MSFRVEVVSPEATVLSGDALFVLARTLTGDVGILEGHAPMLVALGTGKLEIHLVEGEVERYVVDGGFMEVYPDKAVVLADVVEDASGIDVEEARRALDRLLESAPAEPDETYNRRLAVARARIAVGEEHRGVGR